jgi:hypothetical protein
VVGEYGARSAATTANHDQCQQEVAALARVFFPNVGLKERIHRRLNHASVDDAGPLARACRKLYGAKWDAAPDFVCDCCLTNKTHKAPHPRKTRAERAAAAGTGPTGVVSIDFVSWPWLGPRGENGFTLVYNQRMVRAFPQKGKTEGPMMAIQFLRKFAKVTTAKRLGKPLLLTVHSNHFECNARDISDDDADYSDLLVLKSDGAREYMGHELTEFCDEHLIVKKATCGYTPEQNPAENMVKVVTQGVCTLMQQYAGSDKHKRSRWVYALESFVRTYEVTPNGAHMGPFATPYEACYQVHVPLDQLIKGVFPFGCDVYWNIPKSLKDHTHGVAKALACNNLGPSKTKMGAVIEVRDTSRIIDGVHDLFYVETRFSVAERHRAASRRLQQPEDPGPPTTDNEESARVWAEVDESVAEPDHAGADAEGPALVPSPVGSTAKPMTSPPALEPTTPKRVGAGGALTVEDLAQDPVARRAALGDVDLSVDQELDGYAQRGSIDPDTMRSMIGAVEASASGARVGRPARGSQPTPSAHPARRTTRVREPSVKNLENIVNGTDATTGPPAADDCKEHDLQQGAPPRGVDPHHEEGKAPLGESHDTVTPAAAPLLRRSTRLQEPHLQQDALAARIVRHRRQEELAARVVATGKRATATETDPKLSKAPVHRGQLKHRSDRSRWEQAERAHIDKIGPNGLKAYLWISEQDVPEDSNIMRSRWVYSLKERTHGSTEAGTDIGAAEASARAVCLGFTQVHGLDFMETITNNVSSPTLMTMFAIATTASTPMFIEVWDAIGFYYHATPSCRQIMAPPPGVEVPAEVRAAAPPGTKFYWDMLTCFPGTKDAGHCAGEQLADHLVGHVGMTRNPHDQAAFVIERLHTKKDRESSSGDIRACVGTPGQPCVLRACFHVDDGGATSNCPKLMDDIAAGVGQRFPIKRAELKDNMMLGVHMKRHADGMSFNQEHLIEDMMDTVGAGDGKPIRMPWHRQQHGPFTAEDCVTDPEERARLQLDRYPYRQLLGKAGYGVLFTMQYALWIVRELQRHQVGFGLPQIGATEHVVRYLHAHKSRRLHFQRKYEMKHTIIVFVDATLATPSHEGGIILVNGCLVYAMSHRQRATALSTMESEFMAATEMVKVVVWLVRLMLALKIPVTLPVPILEDNSACVFLSEKPNLNGRRTRHMQLRWHWMQEQVKAGLVKLVHVPTEDQVADILTKPVDRPIFNRLSAVMMGEAPLNSLPGVVKALKSVPAVEHLELPPAVQLIEEDADFVPLRGTGHANVLELRCAYLWSMTARQWSRLMRALHGNRGGTQPNIALSEPGATAAHPLDLTGNASEAEHATAADPLDLTGSDSESEHSTTASAYAEDSDDVNVVVARTCHECDREEGTVTFSSTQLKKGAGRRCLGCFAAAQPLRREHPREGRWLHSPEVHCAACGSTKLRDAFSCSQLRKSRENRQCRTCTGDSSSSDGHRDGHRCPYGNHECRLCTAATECDFCMVCPDERHEETPDHCACVCTLPHDAEDVSDKDIYVDLEDGRLVNGDTGFGSPQHRAECRPWMAGIMDTGGEDAANSTSEQEIHCTVNRFVRTLGNRVFHESETVPALRYRGARGVLMHVVLEELMNGHRVTMFNSFLAEFDVRPGAFPMGSWSEPPPQVSVGPGVLRLAVSMREETKEDGPDPAMENEEFILARCDCPYHARGTQVHNCDNLVILPAVVCRRCGPCRNEECVRESDLVEWGSGRRGATHCACHCEERHRHQ